MVVSSALFIAAFIKTVLYGGYRVLTSRANPRTFVEQVLGDVDASTTALVGAPALVHVLTSNLDTQPTSELLRALSLAVPTYVVLPDFVRGALEIGVMVHARSRIEHALSLAKERVDPEDEPEQHAMLARVEALWHTLYPEPGST